MNNNMNIWSILGLILSSSLLTAFITIIANWFLQKDKYKKEYYKLILQRRLQAYELIDEYISNANMRTLIGNELYPTFILEEEFFGIHLVRIFEVKKHTRWISKELTEKLTEYNALLINIDNEINLTMDRKLVAINNLEKIRNFQNEISNILMTDFRDLHNIKSFLKNKNEEKLIKFEIN